MAFQTRKVAIIGAGHVGSHCALSLITMGECDELVMIDTDKPKALAQATDLADAAAYLPHHIRVTSGDYTACRDADIVVVFGGTNDFGHGDAPLGTMSDRTPYTFYGALHCLYTALTEKYPDVPVVILTPLHRLNEDSPKGDNKPEPVGTLKEYVNIIREVAEYYSFPVLDLYKESGLQPKVPVIQQKYIPDGLHPNDDGNAILAHKIARFLETL